MTAIGRVGLTKVCFCFGLLTSQALGAQEESSGSPFFPNFVYSAQVGVGVYERDELTVWVVRVPLS